MNRERTKSPKKLSFAGVVVLACICLGSGSGVGLLYWYMKDDIEAKEKSVFHETLAGVLGKAESYPTVGQYDASTAEEGKVYMNRADGWLLYAAMGVAQGYQSQIKVLVSVEATGPEMPVGDDPRIHRMAVVSSQETPGLGENINLVEKDVSIWAMLAGGGSGESAPKRPWFQEQFSGKRLSDLVVEKTPDTDRVRAVTGATISSTRTTEAARKAVETIIQKTSGAYAE